jgi:hypothetical protein
MIKTQIFGKSEKLGFAPSSAPKMTADKTVSKNYYFQELVRLINLSNISVI